ncbi:hypothetical protein PVAP13_7NG149700 [Panicum virgatum]|uniref:Uncharacterized protein n=1 Tax=Panicum virgatum TaxID=38727 RepID=A0A8T0PU14_PANVG|nr:hypothetical protein PVAP13_7NG149700 [Panicum virgatum]
MQAFEVECIVVNYKRLPQDGCCGRGAGTTSLPALVACRYIRRLKLRLMAFIVTILIIS